MTRKLSSITCALAATILVAAPAHAADLTRLYEGKTVTILFGFSMGGTYGQYSMLLADQLPAFIPGKPNIIVQSMPGAGGLKASNYAANVMPKEGLGLFMPPDSIVINQLLQPDSARYDATEFSWLGNVVESNSVVVVTKRSGITSFEDTKQVEVPVGSTGRGSQTFLVPQMLNSVLGSKFKPIMGYKGSAGSTHAMELDETQGVSLTWLTLTRNRANWFDDSAHDTKAIPIIQVGFRKEPDLQDVPLASEIAPTDEARQIVNFIATLGAIGRGLALPPGAPQALSDELRKSFDALVSDENFIRIAVERGLLVQPKSGEEVQDIVAEVLGMSPEVVEKAQQAIFGGSS